MTAIKISTLAAQVQGLQANGIDCTQWANHHGYALGTGTNESDASARRRREEQDEFNRMIEANQRYHQQYAPDEYNTGRQNHRNRPPTITHSQEQPVVITGKQYLVVCNGRIEYADTKDQAQQTAERVAHAHQCDAYILRPVSKVAPKRDVVTTPVVFDEDAAVNHA